ncbi:unnamed protein product [Brachionus calyciflorus]|uniref:Uncharacterized protein n=1 Tax=Brachionus calyciflorus TaxID=104777 RepID=A0A814NCA8_9BILA|nr:unnamed protein product [Brachionus calyciflorus]
MSHVKSLFQSDKMTNLPLINAVAGVRKKGMVQAKNETYKLVSDAVKKYEKELSKSAKRNPKRQLKR